MVDRIVKSGLPDNRVPAVAAGESEAMLAQETAGKRSLYDDFVATTPCGEVRPVHAGHVTMAFRCPQDVEQAIADVLDR